MALKIGFVGTGWVAGQHMKSLGQIAEARIVACTDVDADRAAEAASRFAGAAAYTDHRKMLDEAGLDAVYVCLPPHVHGQVEMDIIERGLPFFLEKPLANEMETPRRILSAIEEKGLLTAVGYMMRYYPTVARVREFLSAHQPIIARGTYPARHTGRALVAAQGAERRADHRAEHPHLRPDALPVRRGGDGLLPRSQGPRHERAELQRRRRQHLQHDVRRRPALRGDQQLRLPDDGDTSLEAFCMGGR